jgi:hypothetical protein
MRSSMAPFPGQLRDALLPRAAACLLLACLPACQEHVTGGGSAGAGGTSSAASTTTASTATTGTGGAAPACHPDGALCSGKADCCTGACSGRFCGPGAGACTPGDAPVVLASDAAGIFTLTIDATYVYFTTPQADNDCASTAKLQRIPKQGGTPEVLFTPIRVPSVIAVDATNLYWPDEPWTLCDGTTEPGYTLYIAPKGGGEPNPTGSVSAYFYPATDIAVDEEHVFWVNSPSYVFRSDKIVGFASPLGYMEGWPESIAIDETHVYWSCDLGIRRLLKTGGLDPETIAPLELRDARLAVDADALYAAARVVIDTSTARTEVYRFAKDGSTKVTLATNKGQDPVHLTLDDDSVYWTVNKPYGAGEPHLGQVMRVPKAGGTAVQIALGVQPDALAVDDACVYWVDGTSLMKAPK